MARPRQPESWQPRLPSMHSKWPLFDRIDEQQAGSGYAEKPRQEDIALDRQSPVTDARRSGGMIMKMTDPYGEDFKETIETDVPVDESEGEQ
jgi:hypothetical protein